MTWRPRFSLRTLAIFLLLVTSGMGLWWRWEAWYLKHSLAFDADPQAANFSSDGARVHVELQAPNGYRTLTLDTWTGRAMASVGKESPAAKDGPGPTDSAESGPVRWLMRVAYSNGHTTITILDGPAFGGPRRPRPLAELKMSCVALSAHMSADSRHLLVLRHDGIDIYRRRRPEWWWGVFYLWEFWLTVAFAGLFVWSVWRDRKEI